MCFADDSGKHTFVADEHHCLCVCLRSSVRLLSLKTLRYRNFFVFPWRESSCQTNHWTCVAEKSCKQLCETVVCPYLL